MEAPVRRLLDQFNSPQWQWLLKPVVIMTVVLVYSAIGLGPYSGMGTPPMYGDFEAQRHWMEIALHLNPREWYFYDLQWWGLDYPPLSAYHSWLCGVIGTRINPAWFALDASRGYESRDLLAFMRNTVLASEITIYVPAIVAFVNTVSRGKPYSALDKWTDLAVILLQPSLMIIDNGHFQYNCVFLGLFVCSLTTLYRGRQIQASFFFVSSMMFKQMSLYYAPVIFAYILGQCLFPKFQLSRLIGVGLTVLISSVIYLYPFVFSLEQLRQVAFRVFPFARGLWEDKVANFWCTSNTVIKWKTLFSESKLPRLALCLTLAGITPSCIMAARSFKSPSTRQTARVLPWAFACCSWSFYLFSFQVHEKSVLVPLLPSTLLLISPLIECSPTSRHSNTIKPMVFWINNIAYFSMWPLLKRDGLALQYFTVLILWNWLSGAWCSRSRSALNNLAIRSSYSAFSVLCLAERFSLTPLLQRFPDIFVLANCTVSFACFFYFFLWLHTHLLSEEF